MAVYRSAAVVPQGHIHRMMARLVRRVLRGLIVQAMAMRPGALLCIPTVQRGLMRQLIAIQIH